MDASTFEPIRLRVSRELIGLSQNQLATKVGLSPAAISQFESGATRPSPETLDAWRRTWRTSGILHSPSR
jgi:transcriptional regulator with XRE-family HTH domain